jgi:hypothetical protein
MRQRMLLASTLLTAVWGCQPQVFYTQVRGEGTVPTDPGFTGGVLTSLPSLGSLSSIDFNQNQDFRSQAVTKEQVGSSRLEQAQLQILAPADQDFSFLESVELWIKAGDEEALIAVRRDIASARHSTPNPYLLLEVKDTELKPFVAAPSTTILMRGRGFYPQADTRLEATLRLRIELKVF